MARGGERPWNAFWVVVFGSSCWALVPSFLLLSSVGVGAPHGPGLRAALFLYTFFGFAGTAKFNQQVCLLSVPAALAATTPPGWSRLVAAASVLSILIYGWCVTGTEPWRPRPSFYEFVREWGPRWYAETALRGELPDGCTTRCCFAFHPHGVICQGFACNGMFHPYFEKAGRTNWLIDFRLRYGIAPLRWFFDALWSDRLRVHDGGKSTVKAIMAAGENICLVAGGVSEVALYRYGRDGTDMRRRKGLFKYCLQHGYRMFPVYTFGETGTYWSYPGLRGLRLAIARATAMPPVLFFGWPWFPVIPRSDARLITYIGEGIDLPCIEEPTTEQVDHWHAKYLEALTRLFNEKREEAGFPDAELEIL